MGHSYNNGLHTSSKGITIDAVRVTGLNLATCVIAEDCKSGLVSGVTKGTTGVYTFQLTLPYPPKMVVIDPRLTSTNGATAILTPRYREGSYNPTTGQFIIDVSNATPAAADASATAEMHVTMMFNRYTR